MCMLLLSWLNICGGKVSQGHRSVRLLVRARFLLQEITSDAVNNIPAFFYGPVLQKPYNESPLSVNTVEIRLSQNSVEQKVEHTLDEGL